ncbi:MAG: hypothetical protein ACYDH1_04815 [Anaerolineaceae bacterium]
MHTNPWQGLAGELIPNKMLAIWPVLLNPAPNPTTSGFEYEDIENNTSSEEYKYNPRLNKFGRRLENIWAIGKSTII